MGLIVDSSVLIAGERRGESVRQIHPLTLTIAQLAGQIEGEQAAIGNVIAIQDLVIGATALHIGFDVVTANVRHFLSIPRLKVVPA